MSTTTTSPDTKTPLRTYLRAIWILLAMSVRVSPWQSLACLSEPAGQVIQLLQPLYLAWFVAGALHHNLGEVILAAAAFTASSGLMWLFMIIGVHARLLQQERVGFAFDTRIATITGRLPTLDHLESPRYLDELQTLRDQQGALGGALNSLLNTINNLVFVGGTLALAAAADSRLLLVAAAGAPMVIGTRWTIGWQAKAEKASAPRGRLAASLLKLPLTAGPGAELRVFGLAGSMRARIRETTASWRGPWVRFARQESLLETGSNVLFFGVAGGVLAWMTGDAIAGTVSLPVLTLALMLITRLQGTSQSLMWSMRNVSQLVRTARRYLWLEDYEKEVRNAHPGTALPPATLKRGIRLDGVTYRYPESETAAVENINLDLPAGSVVALVGENGAGKSTLVKLLTGMYQPSEGRVLIDGLDLAAMDVDAWRERSSGAFQDYAKLEFAMLESVGVGSLPHVHDDNRVLRALRDGASEELLASAPQGLATQLGNTWPDGVELSGGQWQRLAIARGMMRDEPLLLVLDEPTAALDATTEHALFEQYAAAARQAGRHGAVTILVTHRFSTVSAADLVVVLDRGHVAEIGTHTELVKAGGHYAELYHLQARGYR